MDSPARYVEAGSGTGVGNAKPVAIAGSVNSPVSTTSGAPSRLNPNRSRSPTPLGTDGDRDDATPTIIIRRGKSRSITIDANDVPSTGMVSATAGTGILRRGSESGSPKSGVPFGGGATTPTASGQNTPKRVASFSKQHQPYGQGATSGTAGVEESGGAGLPDEAFNAPNRSPNGSVDFSYSMSNSRRGSSQLVRGAFSSSQQLAWETTWKGLTFNTQVSGPPTPTQGAPPILGFSPGPPLREREGTPSSSFAANSEDALFPFRRNSTGLYKDHADPLNPSRSSRGKTTSSGTGSGTGSGSGVHTGISRLAESVQSESTESPAAEVRDMEDPEDNDRVHHRNSPIIEMGGTPEALAQPRGELPSLIPLPPPLGPPSAPPARAQPGPVAVTSPAATHEQQRAAPPQQRGNGSHSGARGRGSAPPAPVEAYRGGHPPRADNGFTRHNGAGYPLPLQQHQQQQQQQQHQQSQPHHQPQQMNYGNPMSQPQQHQPQAVHQQAQVQYTFPPHPQPPQNLSMQQQQQQQQQQVMHAQNSPQTQLLYTPTQMHPPTSSGYGTPQLVQTQQQPQHWEHPQATSLMPSSAMYHHGSATYTMQQGLPTPSSGNGTPSSNPGPIITQDTGMYLVHTLSPQTVSLQLPPTAVGFNNPPAGAVQSYVTGHNHGISSANVEQPSYYIVGQQQQPLHTQQHQPQQQQPMVTSQVAPTGWSQVGHHTQGIYTSPQQTQLGYSLAPQLSGSVQPPQAAVVQLHPSMMHQAGGYSLPAPQQVPVHSVPAHEQQLHQQSHPQQLAVYQQSQPMPTRDWPSPPPQSLPIASGGIQLNAGLQPPTAAQPATLPAKDARSPASRSSGRGGGAPAVTVAPVVKDGALSEHGASHSTHVTHPAPTPVGNAVRLGLPTVKVAGKEQPYRPQPTSQQ